MSIIGWRKMLVLVWCSTCITVVLLYHIKNKQALTSMDITGLGLIAGLGGFHLYKQNQVDIAHEKKN